MAEYITNVEPNNTEWDIMWGKLHSQKEAHECPLSREVWQYMGTWEIDGKIVHQFRHRSYKNEGRITVNIDASEAFLNSSVFSPTGV
jgi:hypothetical protein